MKQRSSFRTRSLARCILLGGCVLAACAYGRDAAAQPSAAAEVEPVPPLPSAPAPTSAGDDDLSGPEPPDAEDSPSLVASLPWGAWVGTVLGSAGGAVVNVLGGNAEDDLRIPEKHPTRDETEALVVRARVGQVLTPVFFVFSGAMAVWGAVDTALTVMEFDTPELPNGVKGEARWMVAPTPAGAWLMVVGRY